MGVTLVATAVASTIQSGVQSPATVGAEDEATYGGDMIATQDAIAKNLACIERADGEMACFDSIAEAAASKVARAEFVAANGLTNASASSKKKAFKSSGNNRMTITENVYFNQNTAGWAILGYARNTTYTFDGGTNNNASAVDAGDHSGWLADLAGGGGRRYTAAIYSECNYLSGCNSMNDLASSRRRN